MPNPSEVSDKVWADYVFNRHNAPSIKKEWWFHQASGTWFIAERNTSTDTIINTYLLHQPHEVKT